MARFEGTAAPAPSFTSIGRIEGSTATRVAAITLGNATEEALAAISGLRSTTTGGFFNTGTTTIGANARKGSASGRSIGTSTITPAIRH